MRKEIPTGIWAARCSNLQIAQEFSVLSDLFQRVREKTKSCGRLLTIPVALTLTGALSHACCPRT